MDLVRKRSKYLFHILSHKNEGSHRGGGKGEGPFTRMRRVFKVTGSEGANNRKPIRDGP